MPYKDMYCIVGTVQLHIIVNLVNQYTAPRQQLFLVYLISYLSEMQKTGYDSISNFFLNFHIAHKQIFILIVSRDKLG